MQAIEIKNLSVKYGNIKVFDDCNLSIPEGRLVSILGKNGSGKTTLAKILSGRVNYNGDILVFGKKLTKKIINKNIITIYDDMDEYDTADILMNVLVDILKKRKINDIKETVLRLAKEFNFTDDLNKRFDILTLEKKKIVLLALSLEIKPKILILDNLMENINKNLKNIFLKKIRRIVKKEKMTVINISNDVEESMFADMIVIIGDGQVLLKGSKRKVFEQESFFENNDFELPFIVNLSYKLMFYDLINKVYFDEKKLVDDLWE